ncbi:hypothetical protein VNO77_09356 [Canavalia gladiata]|uniref:TIR domain-containing protein n=1 Tax=Canavalia gladiata TaxID=3824 RepID=A0AAN9M967_CANGL
MSSSSSSSSTNPPQWIYDVFLSFRGEDTRDNFVSHLYNALSNAAINTFLDDHALRRGRELRPELMRAIEVSQISIVVFSQGYAQSEWCLMELEKIIKCYGNYGQVVLPVFFDVDPSIVRKQKGAFGEAFKSLKKKGFSESQMQKWRNALAEAAKLAGWDKKNLRDEAELVKIIVDDVLRRGTRSVEGLTLKLHETSKDCFKSNAFKEMNKLRLLQFDCVHLTGDFGYLSKQLRWIYWKGFPLKCIPNNFYQGSVVAIDFKHSHLKQVWKEPQLLEWLKILNLSHSLNLRISPDFSKLPNLEKLILKDCPSLCHVHQSIGELHNLLLINLKGCSNLNNLPRSTYTLKSVKTLIISGCSKIDKLEEDIEQMESLTTLIAEKTAIKQVPFSIVRSKCIGYISLCGYEGLSRDVFPSIISSWMSPTMNPISHIHTAWGMSSFLVSMDVHNYDLDDLSPMLNSLSKVRSILLQCNTKFELSEELRRILNDGAHGVNFTESESYTSKISNHSLRSHLIGIGSYQEVFNILSKSISEELTKKESCDVFLPNDYFPYWRTHRNQGYSVLFRMPQDSYYRLKGMILCVVYSSPPNNIAAECLTSILIVNNTKFTIQIYKRDTAISFNDEDWKDLISHLESGDQVQIFFTFGHELAIKKTAIYLIYD